MPVSDVPLCLTTPALALVLALLSMCGIFAVIFLTVMALFHTCERAFQQWPRGNRPHDDDRARPKPIWPVLLWVLWFFMLLLTDLLPLPRYLQVLLKLVQAVAIFIATLINELCLDQDDEDNEDDIRGGNQPILGGNRVIPRNRPVPRVAHGVQHNISRASASAARSGVIQHYRYIN